MIPFVTPVPLARLGAALWDDVGGAALISAAIFGLFGGAEVGRRLLGLPTEFTRKFTHVGAGVVVLSFPWLVGHTATVVVLALAFAAILVGGRITGLLGSIHGVERRTGGAYYYPLPVPGAWVLSGGDALLYCIPLAVMAVADTGAARVGQRAGETTYRVLDGERTLEGSVTFVALAFWVVLLGCALFGRPPWPDMLLVTLVGAGLSTAAERRWRRTARWRGCSSDGGARSAWPCARWRAPPCPSSPSAPWTRALPCCGR